MYKHYRRREALPIHGWLIRPRLVSTTTPTGWITSPRPCDECGSTTHDMAVIPDVGKERFYLCQKCAASRGLTFLALG